MRILRLLLFVLASIWAGIVVQADELRGESDMYTAYLKNPHFDLDDPVEGGICTYDYDCESNNIPLTNYGILPLTEWERMYSGNGAAAGVYAIGSGAFLGGKDYVVPTIMSDGLTEGKVLGFVTCWGMAVQYTQTTTLPAGEYILSMSYYNTGGTTAIAKNLIGFVADDGTEYFSSKLTFAIGVWTTDEIRFTLTKETSGYFSLGYISTNTGSNNMPHFFTDGISLTYIGNGEYHDGDDLTHLIKNPNFEEADGNGWLLDTSKGGTNSLTNWHGGSPDNYCAEAYMQKFDTYQIINDVPNGVYEVSVQAFYRTGANDVAWNAYINDPFKTGEAQVYSYVYFNDFASPVKNVMEIQFDENLANNCYMTPYGTYTINGMNSASVAFSLKDENMNFTQKVYGLVTDGTIRLGIRNLETDASNTWTLWDNFKLTYRAKNENILLEVLESMIYQYMIYIDSNLDYINDREQNTAYEIIDKAYEAMEQGGDEMYEALIAINNAYNATQSHVAAMIAMFNAIDELEDAINEFAETADPEALDNAIIVLEEAYNVYDLTTEQIITLTERIKRAIPPLKIPQEELNASDDNPLGMTKFIVNADIEQGATVGWNYTKSEGNGPELNVGIDGKSIEFWASYAEALQFNIWQNIDYLPAGKYELTVDASNSLNGCANPENPGRAFLYVVTSTAEGENTYYSSIPIAVQEESCIEKYDNYSVIFTVKKNQSVTIGVKSSGIMTARWFVADNFRLTYYGTESTKEDSKDLVNGEFLSAVAELQNVYSYASSLLTSTAYYGYKEFYSSVEEVRLYIENDYASLDDNYTDLEYVYIMRDRLWTCIQEYQESANIPFDEEVTLLNSIFPQYRSYGVADSHITKVDVSNSGLTTFPAGLLQLPYIKGIDASSNNIADIYVPEGYYNFLKGVDVDLRYQDIDKMIDLDYEKIINYASIMELVPTLPYYDKATNSYMANGMSVKASNKSPLESKYEECAIMIDYNSGQPMFTIASNNGNVYYGNSGDTLYITYPYASPEVEGSFYRARFYFEQGDANFINGVDAADLQATILYDFGEYRDYPFNFTAADTYKDGIINVQDVICTVDILLADETPAAKAKQIASLYSRSAEDESADAYVYAKDGQIILYSDKPVAAVNVKTDGNVKWNVEQYGLSQSTTASNMVGYSLSGTTLPVGETVIGTYDGKVNITNVSLSDYNAQNISVRVSEYEPTGVHEISNTDSEETEIYDAMGRKLNSMTKGINIIKQGKRYIKVNNK